MLGVVPVFESVLVMQQHETTAASRHNPRQGSSSVGHSFLTRSESPEDATEDDDRINRDTRPVYHWVQRYENLVRFGFTDCRGINGI